MRKMTRTHLSPERAAFNDEGFVILRNVFNRSRLQQIVAEISGIFVDQLSLVDVDGRAEQLSCEQAMKRLFDLDLKKYLAATSILARLAGVARLLHSDALWERLQAFGCNRASIPTHPVTHIMSPDLKIPNGYYGIEAHQDWPSMQGSLDAIVVWVPLVDIDAGMNPLELIPGSHRLGLLKAEIGQNESIVDPASYRDEDFIPLEIAAGDVALFSAFTIHRSSKVGRAGVVRMACSTRYENLSEPTYAERGYPCAYRRSIHRELYFPDFPERKQVLEIFAEKQVPEK